MIVLVFTLNRDTIIFEIESKIIIYKDKRYKEGIQFMPKDPDMKKIILFSRNRIPQEILSFIEDANSGKNLEEYNGAKDDEALVPIIIKDAATKGLVFQGRRDA